MSYEPIPAAGAGAGLFDEPALFYLTNQTLIDEWYELRSRVAASVDEWMRTAVREALAVAADDVGLELSEANGPNNRRHLVMHPAGATFVSGKPVIGIGVAWMKTTVPDTNSIFTCVRCSRTKTGKEAATQFLSSGGVEARVQLGAKGAADTTWPIWRWVTAQHMWWTDLDGLRDRIVESVVEIVQVAREPLHNASFVQPVDSNEVDADES